MICNASPLICLSSINQLELLKKLFRTITIPVQVKEEVLIREKPGYNIIKTAIKDKWIKIVTPKQNIILGLGKGETASINLAKERNDTLIIDDASAIKAANALNIPTIRTTTVIFKAIKKKIITKEEAINILNQLINVGYYIAPKEYAVLLTKLKE